MKAVVTGDMGFLGRHFVRALVRGGWQVAGVDVAAAQRWDARDFFRFTRDNLHFDLAIHCAAVVGGRQMIEGSPLELAVDLSLDAELFQWAMRTRPGRVVYISSSAAYPVYLQGRGTEGYRLRESDIDVGPYRPDLFYGWAKLTGELLARHAREAGVAVTVVRPFSGYGIDQDESYPFRAFLERARRREDPFVVWGDGEQVRDFIHVSDIVAATLKMVEEGIDGPVNLGTGIGSSFNQLAEIMCRAAGHEPRIEHQMDKPVGVRYRVADPSKLLEFYEPKVRLESVIEQALAQPVAISQ